MATLEAIIGASTYNLSDGSLAIRIAEDGTGMAPSRRITDRGPLQHGDTDTDYRLEPRIIRQSFMITPATMSEHYASRKTLHTLFRPSNTAMKLRWTLDNGDVRQIDCYPVAGPDFGTQDREGFAQKFVVQFRAPSPLFYDPTGISVTYGVDSGTVGFIFPISFPVEFGSSTVNQTRTITYNGTFEEYPIVIIQGPITNPVITNITTGDKLDFTGTTINSGTTYTIDLRYGVKTVTDNN
jgi:hypothetical protein